MPPNHDRVTCDPDLFVGLECFTQTDRNCILRRVSTDSFSQMLSRDFEHALVQGRFWHGLGLEEVVFGVEQVEPSEEPVEGTPDHHYEPVKDYDGEEYGASEGPEEDQTKTLEDWFH